MSVLKGMKPRVSGNIEATKTFDGSEVNVKDPEINQDTEKNSKKTEKKKYANQSHQMKMSEQLREEVDALKNITRTKFDYELLELLIDSYNRNELSTTDRRKFRALTGKEF